MPYKQPPVDKQFPVNRQNHTKKGPYLVPTLRKLLAKKITIQDPETQKLIKSDVGNALLWRLILNGTEGETAAIKEVLDRVDGKVAEKMEMSGKLEFTQMTAIKVDGKEKQFKLGDK